MRFAEPPIPRDQINLIPTCLGDLIPDNHPIRLLDELLDRLDWTPFERKFRIAKSGRPPLRPKLLCAIWIYAFFRQVSSSRQLEYQLKTNIEFMWLAHGHRIDHSTLSAFRKENKASFKKAHSDLIRLVKDMGVIKIAELYVDGTRIAANANRSRTMTAERATKLLNIVENEIDEYLKKTELTDEVEDLFGDSASGEELPDHLDNLHKRKDQLEEIIAKCNEMDEIRKKQRVDPKKNPFQLPVTDPESRILPNKTGGYAPNYTPIVGVEGELGLIVSSQITNCANEQDYLVATVDEVERTFDVSIEIVGADAAYSIAPNIVELEDSRGKDFLSPHRSGDVPEENPAIRDDPTKPVDQAELDKLPTDRGKFSVEAFVYDEEKDVHYCPQGRELRRSYEETTTQSGGHRVTRTIYQAQSCEGCPLLSRCRVGENHKSGRRVGRSEHAKVVAAHREKMSTRAAKGRYQKRFYLGERPFAQIKQGFGLRRFQTRGLEAVSSEFNLAALADTLLRLRNHFGSLAELRKVTAATL